MINLILTIYLFSQTDWALFIVDSSYNAYTLWTQMQEGIGYNPIVDGIQFVNRAYSPSGVLNIHQTDGALSFWIDDLGVYNEVLGPARYPNSIASNPGPHISFSYLFPGPHPGGAGAIYESGG